MNFDRRPYKLFRGDCIDVMKRLPANSVDAMVTDPPYGWRFMGEAWDGADIEKVARANAAESRKVKYFVDNTGRTQRKGELLAAAAGMYDLSLTGNVAFQKWTEEWAREALRILKPGAHVLIFCGPRTYHRMASGVEDAGFEVRDQLQWLFGSGFPKSLDISKAIDKAMGAERSVIGEYISPENTSGFSNGSESIFGVGGLNPITAPSTAAAKQWSGWGTALKPANEPILLARKPLSEKTVAKNVLKWGTGGINVDGGRIEGPKAFGTRADFKAMRKDTAGFGYHGTSIKTDIPTSPAGQGRFPSNLLLDEEAARLLDAQTGNRRSAGNHRSEKIGTGEVYSSWDRKQGQLYADSGGASRFFYVAKASKRERNTGCEGQAKEKQGNRPNSRDDTGKFPDHDHRETGGNNHPTVKPFRLMRYLIQLVTPPGGIVLEPFLGSGTTGAVAVACGFRFIGIEREDKYFEIARARIKDVKLKNQSEISHADKTS